MPDWLANIWANQSIRYLAATALGFTIAVLGEQINALIERKRTRATVREALAQEVAYNLSTLDHYYNLLNENTSTVNRVWPTGNLRTALLESCLDLSVNSVLTPIERVQSATAYYQCLELADKMARSISDSRVQPGKLPLVSENILVWDLPIVAQTHVDLLCNVLKEQSVFAYTYSEAMKHSLLPLYEANALSSERTWRTSAVPDNEWKGPFLIAWRNDDPNRVPPTVQVVELRPPDGRDRVVDVQRHTWYRRPFEAVHNRVQGCHIRRTAAQLKIERAIRPQAVRPPIERASDGMVESDS